MGDWGETARAATICDLPTAKPTAPSRDHLGWAVKPSLVGFPNVQIASIGRTRSGAHRLPVAFGRQFSLLSIDKSIFGEVRVRGKAVPPCSGGERRMTGSGEAVRTAGRAT